MRSLPISKRILLIVLAPLLVMGLFAALTARADYDRFIEAKVAELRHQVDTAISAYRANPDLSADDAFKILSNLSFGDGDYFFGVKGTTILFHPDASIVGKDMKDAQDKNGVFPFRDLSAQISESGEAQVSYLWPRADETEPTPKISYGRLVPGEDFYVVTGVYTDKIDAAFYADLAANLLNLLILSGAICGVSVYVCHSVSGPLKQLHDRMLALTRGDVAAPVADLDATDELGEMARALDGFRRQALEIQELSADKERRDAEAREKHQLLMNELSQAFGLSVEAAVNGDFSRRVPASFPEPELNALAAGMNQLLETIGEGVSATAHTMSSIAQGDLNHRMQGDFKGAFASLQTDVNDTVGKLSGLIAQIAETTITVRRHVAEITNGSIDLSTRAEKQASSLQETAATMDEMAASVRCNATAAQEAGSLARDASDRAEGGSQIVADTVCAMKEIEDGAVKISDIISVIDGIAFQTNLLALNAAVEAARAGDAGKGFAVVASEVRSLAQRSSEASQDIRSLIATSVSQVSNGARLAVDAGEALKGIASSIEQVDSAVQKISVACSEQATGVEDVSSSVSEMDQMTQKNAVLAERSAATAQTLMSEAERLEELISFFIMRAPSKEMKAA